MKIITLLWIYNSRITTQKLEQDMTLSLLGQCCNNEDHHTFMDLQLKNYNSKARTRYDSIWMHPAVYRDMQWINSAMYERIMNGGFATNTMSTTWSCKEQYDNDETCHNKRNGGKLHGNISWNGYGNAIIGRYGGCFEEDIMRFMCDRAYRITGFGCTGEVCTKSQGEKGQCTVR